MIASLNFLSGLAFAYALQEGSWTYMVVSLGLAAVAAVL